MPPTQLELDMKQQPALPNYVEELYDMTRRQYGGLFKMMEVTEEEISAAMERYPDRAGYIWNSFGMFGEDVNLFSSYSIELWRYHCRELLDRLGNPQSRKEDRELGTIAEVMIGICEASLVQPLTTDATYAYAKIFKQVFGERTLNKLLEQSGTEFYESYSGAVDELIDWARKKASKPRKYPTEPALPM